MLTVLEPQRGSAPSRRAGKIVIQIEPRGIAFTEDFTNSTRLRIHGEEALLGLLSILHEERQRSVLGPAHTRKIGKGQVVPRDRNPSPTLARKEKEPDRGIGRSSPRVKE